MKSWKLRTQLAFGFAFVLLFTCIVGGAGLLSLTDVVNTMTVFRQTSSAQDQFAEVREQYYVYLLNSHEAGRQPQAKARDKALESLKEVYGKINERFKNIQGNLQEYYSRADHQLGLIGKMQAFDTEVNAISLKMMDDSRQQMEKVNGVIDKVNSTVALIFTAVEEQAAATDISHDISQVRSDARQMLGSCVQVGDSSDTLNVLAKDLGRIVGRFKY